MSYEAGYKDGYEDAVKDVTAQQSIQAEEVDRVPDSYDVTVDGNVDRGSVGGSVAFGDQAYEFDGYGSAADRGSEYEFKASDGRTGTFWWSDIQTFDNWANGVVAKVWAEADPEYGEGGYGRARDGEISEVAPYGAEW